MRGRPMGDGRVGIAADSPMGSGSIPPWVARGARGPPRLPEVVKSYLVATEVKR